jgi:hypothetical protein
MTCSRVKGFVGILIAGSMIVSSSAAGAQTAMPVSGQGNSWAALSLLAGGAPAAAFCGSAAVAAAQAPAGHCVLPAVDTAAAALPPVQTVAPAPPPPVEAGVNPLIFALGAIALGAAIFLLSKGHGRGTFLFPPNSPT